MTAPPCVCGACVVCLVTARPEYRRLYAGPCPHEGPVVEPSANNCEKNHVRLCLHDGADWSRCTRGPNSGADPDVRSCVDCPLRPPG